MRDVTQELGTGDIPDADLITLIQARHPGGMQRFPGALSIPSETDPEFQIHFSNSSGRILRILSKLNPVETRELKEQLLGLSRSTRNSWTWGYFFTYGAPLTSGILIPDVLQIRPVPPNAPNTTVQYGPYPAILGVTCPETASSFINGRRMQMKIQSAQQLLQVLLRNVRPAFRTSEPAWGHVHGAQGPVQLDIFTRDYFIPSWNPNEAFDFTATPPRHSMEAYFRGITEDNAPFAIFDRFEEAVQRWGQLNEADRDVFYRASYWISEAEQRKTVSGSASLVAAVQAIETLLPSSSGKRCEVCGQIDHHLGARFRELVETFGPSDARSDLDRKMLYALRSKLTHGGTLLGPDVYLGLASLPRPGGINDDWLPLRATYVARVVLTNWLLTR